MELKRSRRWSSLVALEILAWFDVAELRHALLQLGEDFGDGPHHPRMCVAVVAPEFIALLDIFLDVEHLGEGIGLDNGVRAFGSCR